MHILWDCADHGWENVWKKNVITSSEPVILDVVATQSVDMSEYDLLASRKAGA